MFKFQAIVGWSAAFALALSASLISIEAHNAARATWDAVIAVVCLFNVIMSMIWREQG